MDDSTYQLMTAYLARLYDVQPYQRHGIEHPIQHFDPDPEQRADIDSILGHLSDEVLTADQMAIYNYGYLHSLQNSRRTLYDGRTFALKRLRHRPLRLDAAIGSYFNMIATCAALEQELRAGFANNAFRFPMRAQYHRAITAQETLTQGTGRDAALGGVLLIVYQDEGAYYALVSWRTHAHATHPNTLHLLPAFIFQPLGAGDARSQWSFKQHVYREYLEEIVGMPENVTCALDAHPAYQALQAMEADGRAVMQLTGASFNLMTLRVEISAVLVIHDPQWWQGLQQGTGGYRLHTPEASDQLLALPIYDDQAALAALPDQYYLQMVTQAIPALWEGITAARRIIAAHHTT